MLQQCACVVCDTQRNTVEWFVRYEIIVVINIFVFFFVCLRYECVSASVYFLFAYLFMNIKNIIRYVKTIFNSVYVFTRLKKLLLYV